MMDSLGSCFGLVALVALCYATSSNRKAINWKTVSMGIFLQIAFAFICLKTEAGRAAFDGIKNFFESLMNYSNQGADFVFGDLAKGKFVFAIHVGATIIFCSALMSALYYLGVMQKVIKYMSFVMVKLMGISGSESVSATGNIFLGQTESCLIIKPYLKDMTRSEMFSLMVTGLSTIATSVVGAYLGMGLNPVHILAASFISAPAGVVIAKILIPETEVSPTAGKVQVSEEQEATSLIDALMRGSEEGVKLLVPIVAALIVFVALLPLLDNTLHAMGLWVGLDISFSQILGYVMAPVAWVIGVPWNECLVVGQLLGKKLILNEFVAYMDLLKVQGQLSPRTIMIATYALCGFANFSAVAVMIGGIKVLAPSRGEEALKLGMKSLYAGTIACLMTACVAGLLF